MTPNQMIAATNQRALARSQEVCDAIRAGGAGRPGPIPMALNPNSERRIKRWLILDWSRGAWVDQEGGGRGDDLIDAIVWMADMDDDPDARERASVALRAFLEALPEPAPPLMRPRVEHHEVERLPPKVRPVRSLRRC